MKYLIKLRAHLFKNIKNNVQAQRKKNKGKQNLEDKNAKWRNSSSNYSLSHLKEIEKDNSEVYRKCKMDRETMPKKTNAE